jgi:hypothetical protein
MVFCMIKWITSHYKKQLHPATAGSITILLFWPIFPLNLVPILSTPSLLPPSAHRPTSSTSM